MLSPEDFKRILEQVFRQALDEAEKNNAYEEYEEKVNKLRVEDTHIRRTFLVRRDLNRRIDQLAEGKRGYKSHFINKAIQKLLDETEE